MKTHQLYTCLILSFSAWAGTEVAVASIDSDQTSGQTNTVKHAFISSGGDHSSAEGFHVRTSVAEPAIGYMNASSTTIEINAGFIKPNTDLIFINSLEME